MNITALLDWFVDNVPILEERYKDLPMEARIPFILFLQETNNIDIKWYSALVDTTYLKDHFIAYSLMLEKQGVNFSFDTELNYQQYHVETFEKIFNVLTQFREESLL